MGIDATAKPRLDSFTPRHSVPKDVFDRLKLVDDVPVLLAGAKRWESVKALTEQELSNTEIYARKTPRTPSSETFFSFAAFASLRDIFRLLVVALPRW